MNFLVVVKVLEVRENGLVVVHQVGERKAWVSSKTQQNKPHLPFHASPGMKDKLQLPTPFPHFALLQRTEHRGSSRGLSWGQGPGSQESDWGEISAETREP